MRSMLKVFTIFTPQQQIYCGLIILAMVIGALFEAVGIGAILPLISLMGDSDFLNRHEEFALYISHLHIQSQNEFIIACAFVLIIFYTVKNLYMAWQVRLQIRFAVKNQIFFAEQLFAEYLNKPYLYHLDHNSAILLRNVGGGALTTFSGLLIPLFAVITEVITALIIWSMLIWVDPFTAVVVAGFLGLTMYGILKLFRKKIAHQGIVQNECSTVYTKWLYQGLGAIKETKVSGKEQFFQRQFSKAYDEYGKMNGDFIFLNQLPRLFIESIVVSGLLLLIIMKLSIGLSPMEIVPLLGVLALAAFRLMPCANRIVNLLNGIKFQTPLFEEIYEDLMAIKYKQQRMESKEVLLENKMVFSNKIIVQGVSFQYPSATSEVLQKIDFSIPKGSFIGIVGPSGAGKTTFVDILLGLLKPVSGMILVDDKNIWDNIHSWQKNLSYVPQSIYLIDGSIRENIALGVNEEAIDDEQIKKVLEMAELQNFIETLADGIYTHVGERGVKLSGGQRQRIGIARALYYKPEVLILDEATSALDNDTEKNITGTILKLRGEITVVAIAHRVSTLEECDFKIQFEDGKATII